MVLFDAIEEATFPIINNMDRARCTLRNVKEEAVDKNQKEALKDYLKRFKVRTVLTAHPTIYPGSVLGIITDLAKKKKKNQLENIKLFWPIWENSFFKNKTHSL